MKNVLLLSDFSNTARNAALYALKMFQGENVRFTLLNSFDLEFSGSPYVVQLKDELALESDKSLISEVAILQRAFPNTLIQVKSIFGSLIQAVHEFISDYQPELVVLGCRGESALENFLLGSNAYEVIKNINAPILVVPKSVQFKKPDKIVFATDLKDVDNDEVIQPVRNIVDKFQSSLMLVNVLDDQHVNRLDAETKIAAHFPKINLSFNFIEGDDIAKSIHEFADENDAEMITLVRHNLGFLDRLFNPSVTKRMVMHPEHPMLILHEELE